MNPMTRTRRARFMTGACAALLVAGLAACGSDESTNSSDTDAPVATEAPSTDAPVATEAPSTDAPSTEAPSTEAPGTDAPSTDAPTDDTTADGEYAEVCAVAEEMFQSDLPSVDLVQRYQAVAPDEIADAVDTAATAIVDAGDDMVALFNALADDDVEAATDEINAWETENCGIEHSESDPAPGTSTEVEDGANVVEVTATDYEFDIGGKELSSGRTSFVLTNQGEEAHFMLIVKLQDGVTLEDALNAQDPTTVLDGEWETKLAQGGGDEEVITFDVEPGSYGALCFIPGPDGETPHAFMGMQQEFTVS